MGCMSTVSRIAAALSLPERGQDWGIEHADPLRLDEFVDFADRFEPEHRFEPEWLAELILQSTEEAMELGLLTRRLRDKVIAYIRRNCATFPETAKHWSTLREEDGWRIAALLREACGPAGTTP
jgi:hypothetical protein